MPERPFVVEPPGSIDTATDVAARAAEHWGLPEPTLIRMGMNGVFTAGDDTVLRVSRPTTDPMAALRVAHILDRAGLRVPLPMRDEVFVDGPLAVFAVERVVPCEALIDWEAVGAMVHRLHGVDTRAVGAVHPLPLCIEFPWWNFEAMLDDVSDLVAESTMPKLRAAFDRHRVSLLRARTEPTVLLHGDVHPGNVIMTDDGPVLMDWDLLCVGPPGWDHAPLMTWTERWGGEEGIYDAFAAGYGQAMRGDRIAEAFAELRLLAATLMRLRAGRSDHAAAQEADRRLRWWRGDADAPQWVAS